MSESSNADEARAEAERRFPDDFSHEGDRYASRALFVQGAEWQASRSIEITDAMAATVAAYIVEAVKSADQRGFDAFHTARSALSAALGGTEEGDTK